MGTTSIVKELESEGFVRLPAGFDPGAADRMRSRVWRDLAVGRVREADPSTWPAGRQGKALGSKQLQTDRSFDAIWSKNVVGAIDAFLGRGCWARPATELLLTFPQPNEPLRQLDPFHSDFAMDVSSVPLFAVNVFAFIATVGPRSGGTLVIRRSHRLAQRYLDALPAGFPRRHAASQFAADHRWLASLRADDGDPIGATFDANGIDLRVEELIGAPGDVVITHPWTLHAGITSQGSAPRMMLRYRILRSSPVRASGVETGRRRHPARRR